MSERSTIKKTDILFIVVILVAAIFIYAFTTKEKNQTDFKQCIILWDGETVETVDLGKDGIFQVDEVPQMRFEIKNSMIAVIHSDCPDKLCEETGFIKKAGQKIVCLPNKIIVSIESERQELKNADEPDAVVQ